MKTSIPAIVVTLLATLAGPATAASPTAATTPEQAPPVAEAPAPADNGTATAATAATPAPDVAPAPAPRPTSADAQRYLDAVEELQGETGAYDPGLAQHLFGLGRTYHAEGQYDLAIATLNRAAHITRVNEGLYSIGGIPILQQLIQSNVSLGQWDAVSSNYQRIHQIEQHSYGENDARLLPTLQKLTHWHLRAYLDALGGEPVNHLLAARGLNDASLRILQAQYGAADTRTLDELRRSALVNYYLATFDYPDQRDPFAIDIGSQGMPAARPSYAISGYSSGRRALEQILAVHSASPQSSALDKGRALAELGDWNLLFSHDQTAQQLYVQAWATAVNAGADGNTYTRQLFGEPLELPILPDELATPLGPSSAAPDPARSLTASFAVDGAGQPRNIAILQSVPPASNSAVSDLRHRLRAARFRPRLVDGVPVETPGLVYRIVHTP